MEIKNEGPFLQESADKLVLIYFGSIETSNSPKENFFDGVYGNFAEDFHFHVVNVEQYPDLANTMKVYDFPKIVLVYQGKEIDRLNAPFSPKELLPRVINAMARMKN